MHNPIHILKTKYDLPFDRIISDKTGERFTSVLEVMQNISALEMDNDEYIKSIYELAGQHTALDFSNPHSPRVVFGYFVQNLTNAHKDNTQYEVLDLLTKSAKQAAEYIANTPWSFQLKENVVDENKPLSKKELAIKIWNERKDTVTTRKEWIEILMNEVEMTKPGAGTYYHNLKHGIYK